MKEKHATLRGITLSFRHKVWLYGSFGILFLSGVIWQGFELWKPHQSSQMWLLKIHGAAAMLALVLLGTLIPLHIKRAWKADINRKNGVLLIGVNLILIITGYGLYYASENLQNLSKIIHVLLGVLLPFIIVWHIVSGRREKVLLKARQGN